jgi:hypothetical protein
MKRGDCSPDAGLRDVTEAITPALNATPAGKRLMRLLVDTCIDERVHLLSPGHYCQTARFAIIAGLKNRRLLDAAEALMS